VKSVTASRKNAISHWHTRGKPIRTGSDQTSHLLAYAYVFFSAANVPSTILRLYAGPNGPLRSKNTPKCDSTAVLQWYKCKMARKRKFLGKGASGTIPFQERKRFKSCLQIKVHTHTNILSSRGSIWHDDAALPGAGLPSSQHRLYLLQCSALSFWYHKVDEDEAQD